MALYYNDSTKLYVVQMNTCSVGLWSNLQLLLVSIDPPLTIHTKRINSVINGKSTNFWILYGVLLILFILITVNLLVYQIVHLSCVLDGEACLCLVG